MNVIEKPFVIDFILLKISYLPFFGYHFQMRLSIKHQKIAGSKALAIVLS